MHLHGHSSAAQRVRIELVEADVEQGFGLVDLAEATFLAGDSAGSARILEEADRVVADIEARLLKLGALQSGPFIPLLSELRREIEEARKRPD
jgi:hypothetical protein